MRSERSPDSLRPRPNLHADLYQRQPAEVEVGCFTVAPARLRCMDSGGTSESGLGNYVSLAELAAELKVSVQTIYDLRSKGRGPHGFRVGTQLRFRKSEIDAWVERMEQADEQRHAGGAA